MARRDEIAQRAANYGQISTQSLSDYLATLGLFLTLCISGMLTFVGARLIEARFPGTPQAAYWILGMGIFVAAYFAYGQIRVAPLLAPVLFIAMLWLCREVVLNGPAPGHTKTRASHATASSAHQKR
jgi:hypothetical protein